MIISQIYHIKCDKCSGSFYINMGDPDDCTAYEVNAVGCPWCNHRFFLSTEDFYEDEDAEEGESLAERQAYELEHCEIGEIQLVGREGKLNEKDKDG